MATTLHRHLRKLFRSRQKRVAELNEKADVHLEHNFARRIGSLLGVRRFVIVWVALVVLLVGCVVAQINALGGYYQTIQPVPGGIYSEGVVGSFTNANPIYATGQVDDAVSKLLFASLFSYDDKNNLVGDLAKSYDVDAAGTTYTVRLKPGLKWHDGQPLTARDVAFTYRTIQNPDAHSPLATSWQRVIITSPDATTVRFKLPNPLSSFPYSLTTGIVPEHVLGKTPVSGLRSAAFNTIRPVGAGPFKFKTLEVKGNTPATRQVEVALEPFEDYQAGAPKLNSFVVHTFPDDKEMVKRFQDQTITAMVGLRTLPPALAKDDAVQSYGMPLAAGNFVFFKTTSGVLSDSLVRRALVGGVDTDKVREQLGYMTRAVREPILQGQPGFSVTNEQLHAGTAEAKNMLTAAGWVPDSDGIRSKAGQKLSFKFYAENTPENATVSKSLHDQWRALGVDAQVYLQSDADLRSTSAYHSYDALLYGISVGVDPDVFAYWHSSQADVRSASRLNFSEYSSPVADEALEAGRTRTEASLRAVKYQQFLYAWQQDAPALGLYQPRFLYVTRGPVHNLTEHTLVTDTDRFDNVHNWMIRTAPRTPK